MLGGRGAGKTRTGAEFVRESVKCGAGRIAMIAPTAPDARDIMVEGESGLLACSTRYDYAHDGTYIGYPKYYPSKRRIVWANGARATLYSAEEPDRLRGPQHDRAWADELAAWAYLQETWDNLMFGLRLALPDGSPPRVAATTTPRPLALLRSLVKDVDTRVSSVSTFANEINLPPQFIRRMRAKYEGTRTGRQELYAEILNDVQGALWTLDGIAAKRVRGAPAGLEQVVVAVDPSGSTEDGDAQGIVVAGTKTKRDLELGDLEHGYVLHDGSMNGMPHEWARRAVDLYYEFKADHIVAEINYGGEMVRSTIYSVDPGVPVHVITATRGKVVRASPVSTMYDRGRIHHVGAHKELEDQMSQMTSRGYVGEGSPDRVDALVWAFTDMLIRKAAPPGASGRQTRVRRQDRETAPYEAPIVQRRRRR